MIPIIEYEEEALQEIRKDLVNDVYLTTVFASAGAILATVFRNLELGIKPQPGILGLLLTIGAALYLFRSRISPRLLGAFLIVSFQISGGYFLYQMGPAGIGSWNLVNSVLQGWLLLRRREAWLVTGSALVIHIGCWYFHRPGPVPDFNSSAPAWFSLFTFLLLLGSLVFVTARQLFRVVQRRHDEAKAAQTLRSDLLESLQEAVLVIDPAPGREGIVLEANKAAEILFDIPRAQLVGSRFQDMFAPTAPKEENAPGQTVLPDGTWIMEYLRPDGTRFLSEIATSRHKVGGKDRILVCLRGIAERIRRHNDLSRLKEELEQRVERRTRQLEQSREEIRAFSYAVSHDLRAPLRTVNGFASALREDYSDILGPEDSACIQAILEGTERIQLDIEALLELSRLERRELGKEWIDLRAYVEAACLGAANPSHSPSSERTRIVGEWPERIETDPILQRSMWTNIVNDALRNHPDREHALIEIRAKRLAEGTIITLSPVATGSPIPKTSDQTPSSRSTIARLLEKLGGTCRTERTPQGTLIHVRLPDVLMDPDRNRRED